MFDLYCNVSSVFFPIATNNMTKRKSLKQSLEIKVKFKINDANISASDSGASISASLIPVPLEIHYFGFGTQLGELFVVGEVWCHSC